MNHPFKSSGMRRWKRRSRILYLLLCLIQLPKYLLWLGSELLVSWDVSGRVRKVLSVPMDPVRAVYGFILRWCKSREYKRLWLASPVLIAMFVAGSAVFIKLNKERGGAYEGYYDGALAALSTGDMDQADFLFGKIIQHPYYKEDPTALYRALIAANGNRNLSRARSLEAQLVEEFRYEPAMRWVMENALRFGVQQDRKAELEVMAKSMVGENQPASIRRDWRIMLGQFYMATSRYDEALYHLKKVEKSDFQSQLLLARVYLSKKDVQGARSVLEAVLKRADGTRASRQVLMLKVEAMVLLSDIVSQHERRALLAQAVQIVESERQLSIDRQYYSGILAQLFVKLARVQLELRGDQNRIAAFRSLEASLKTGVASSEFGKILHEMVDDSSAMSLYVGDLKALAAEAGGCVVQLTLALAAWDGADDATAALHLGIARQLDERGVDVLRSVAMHRASTAKSNNEDEGGAFLGGEKTALDKAQDLLNWLKKEAPEKSVEILFDQCQIFNALGKWQELVDQLEPQIRQLDENDRIRAYQLIINAYVNLKNPEKVQEYQKALQGKQDKVKVRVLDEE